MTIADDLTPTPQSASTADLTIEGITESVVVRYFETMNAGEYEETAALFAEVGVMQPPFEQPIAGREAIASYLEAEAKGMKLSPRKGIAEILEDNQTEIQVTGKVQTSVFGVNVSWIFVLSPEQEILFTKIKLLASPQELLNLRR
jgi:hypothetical protein